MESWNERFNRCAKFQEINKDYTIEKLTSVGFFYLNKSIITSPFEIG